MAGTGVLVHGCHLQAVGWEHMVWGVAPNQPGRIVQGVFVALESDGGWLDDATAASSGVATEGAAGTAATATTAVPVADVAAAEGETAAAASSSPSRGGCTSLVFGTGASQNEAGQLEAEATVALLWERFDRLSEFTELFGKRDASWWAAAKTRLEELVVTDIKSQNTVQEVAAGVELVKARGGHRLVLVSSPTHISRCLRDAVANLDAAGDPMARHVFATSSATTYTDTTTMEAAAAGADAATPVYHKASDVVIMEPPHRGDRDKIRLDLLAARMLRVSPEKKQAFHDDLDRFLTERGL